MPIYEYQCQSCYATEEHLQKFSDDPKTTCQSCEGKLKKLISSTSFQLKGTGWYATDYGQKSSSNTSSSPKSVTEKTSSADGAGCGKEACGSVPKPAPAQT